jgi:hypothetical protein
MVKQTVKAPPKGTKMPPATKDPKAGIAQNTGAKPTVNVGLPAPKQG